MGVKIVLECELSSLIGEEKGSVRANEGQAHNWYSVLVVIVINHITMAISRAKKILFAFKNTLGYKTIVKKPPYYVQQ